MNCSPKEQADYSLSMTRDRSKAGNVVTGEYTFMIGNKEMWFCSQSPPFGKYCPSRSRTNITGCKKAEQELSLAQRGGK